MTPEQVFETGLDYILSITVVVVVALLAYWLIKIVWEFVRD